MKKIFTTLALICAVAFTFAQAIPNASFEEWSDTHTATGWNSAFNASIPVEYSGFNLNVVIDFNAATRLADGHTGEYSVQLNSQEANAQMMEMNIYTINLPGMIQLGDFDIDALTNLDFENADIDNMDLTQYIHGGVAFNQIPTKMKAYVTYTTTADTMVAAVMLTRWNNGQREVVAKGELQSSTPYNDFTQIEVPITVQEGMEGVTPDTLNIIFSTAKGMADANTIMVIDDVELAMGDDDAIFEIGTLPIFSVRPNPATENIILTPATNENYAARMFDTNGKLVWENSNLQGETTLNVSNFTKGVYFLQVKQGQNVKSQKVLVK